MKAQECRVAGCEREAFIKKERLCAMHSGRLRRTGELGPAAPYAAGGSQTPRHIRKAADQLAKVVRAVGKHWSLSPERGAYKAAATTGRKRSTKVSNSTVWGLERRGWIRVGDFRSDGTRSAQVTAEGSQVLREGVVIG